MSMTHLKKFCLALRLLLAANLIGLAAPSFAQSAFSGFYGQVGIGYENSVPSYSGGTLYGITPGPLYSYGISGGTTDSFAGTVALGYYFPVTDSFLLGVGAEYSPLQGASSNATVSIPALKYTEYQSIRKNDSYNLFISPAYAIDQEKLAYVKAGYSGATFEIGGYDILYSGYSLGLGYRQIIKGAWYGFAEVNYTSYGNQNIASNGSGTASFKVTNALVGLGYQF
jgi:outer membrane immunogenic protein